MAMFDKPKSGKTTESEAVSSSPATSSQTSYSAPSSKLVATIGASIQIKGDISGDENLVVEGTVEGKIQLKSNDVTVGPSGKVRADVVAKVITVNGEVQGDLHGLEKVVVAKSGRIQGNISSPRVILEDGAKFKGSIDMDPGESFSSERPAAAISPANGSSSQSGPGAARVAPVPNPDDKQLPLGGAVKNG